MKAHFKTGLPILFLIIFISCKKNDSPPQAAQKTLLTKATYSTAGVYTYTYDASNRLLTETYGGFGSNPAFTSTITNYDALGRVTEYIVDYVSASYPDQKAVNSYNASGKLERVLFFNINGGALDSYITFDYPTNKVVRKFYSNSNSLINSSESTFSGDGKNIIETKQFNASSSLISTQVYSNYDTKKSTSSLFPYGYFYIEIGENNYQNFSNTNNITSVVTSTSLTYEYNSDGYVTKRTSSTGSTTLYEYIKK
jgi:YD repeat-containing protein